MGRRLAIARTPEAGGEPDLPASLRPRTHDATLPAPDGALLVEHTSPYLAALLPWESRAEFEVLLDGYRRHFQPVGPMEASLVDQLVWLDWRRRRLVLGERAAHMAALEERTREDYRTTETLARATLISGGKAEKDELAAALRTSADDHTRGADEIGQDEAMTRRAIALLQTGDPAAYAEALATVREDTALWWEDVVGDDEQTHPNGLPRDGEDYRPHTRTTASLLRFLLEDVMPIHAKSHAELARRPAIRLQVYGESLDPFRFDRLLSLEERLARCFEKLLGTLTSIRRPSRRDGVGECARSQIT